MSRPRGWISDYNPRSATLELLSQVEGVLHTYAAELPLTARQVFYRLVATVNYPKSESGYTRLQEHLANFRRAGIVDFSTIRDDGTIVERPFEYSSVAHFIRTARRLAQQGQGVRLEGQPQWIELWCEAAGMAPQLARVAGEYGVTVYSSGGFDSVTSKYEAAMRVQGRDVPTVVLHVGDHDPSGLALFEAAAEDVEAFAGYDMVRFERVAVTVDQIERYQLPTAPAKARDKRSAWVGGGTVQAEALPPDVLADEVRQAVIAELDMEVFGEAQETEARNREAVWRVVQQLEDAGDNEVDDEDDD